MGKLPQNPMFFSFTQFNDSKTFCQKICLADKESFLDPAPFGGLFFFRFPSVTDLAGAGGEVPSAAGVSSPESSHRPAGAVRSGRGGEGRGFSSGGGSSTRRFRQRFIQAVPIQSRRRFIQAVPIHPPGHPISQVIHPPGRHQISRSCIPLVARLSAVQGASAAPTSKKPADRKNP